MDGLGDAQRIWATLAERAGDLRSVPGRLPHPLLGPFRAAQWMRFARLHTAHHLAIIKDIDGTEVAGEPEADPLAPLGESP